MNGEKSNEQRRLLKVYTIVEKTGNPKGFWLDIGIANVNRDGSISAKLDALPVNGSIHLRQYEPRRNETVGQNGDQEPPYERHKGGIR